ncbi:MAG: ATP-binding protein [Betaproteobacteria bacterium]|nr:ATP-binding protein [Betaproteobacteria bacterium]
MGIDPIPEGGVVLSVVDNGPGISRLDWERLTVRWAKGPSAISLRNGTGLGLYLVAEYCRILRAELHLDTSESARTGLGQGAQIKLRFTS